MSRTTELEQASKELVALYGKVKELAAANSFGVTFDEYDGSIEFEDWLSSDCYGEGNSEAFGVGPNGPWYSSSC